MLMCVHRTMRDEIERERKGQESVLRDMRQSAAAEGGGMTHQSSAARLPPASNQRSGKR